eukprot:CAMPEP_0115014782 /NCGR_PEP_ID=MMETSP0216-20121206/26310_1 /TAXON_ID=223996 /ORGANISM="Protocruzia adherens, Strain Boccale" /LENGTH=380 /DNA_ID=CAMNT_0002384641 /DNA_START=149 /DNA_END=1291 /DNA_ORIENTATION=+
MKRQLSSVTDFAELLNKNIKKKGADYGQIVFSTAGSFSDILAQLMTTTKGRDKICSIIQYCAKLYAACVQNSNLPETVKFTQTLEGMKSLDTAKRVSDSMSQGRKAFRFMKFVVELSKLRQVYNKKAVFLRKILLYSIHTCSFIYYFFDHLVWLASMGIIMQRVVLLNWKKWKDIFSLAKAFLQLFNSFYITTSKQIEEMVLEESLENEDSKLVKGSHAFSMLTKLIKIRRKRRFNVLRIFQNVCRIFLLSYSLSILKKGWVSPITVSVAGLLSCLISLFKLMTKRQEYVKVEKKDMSLADELFSGEITPSDKKMVTSCRRFVERRQSFSRSRTSLRNLAELADEQEPTNEALKRPKSGSLVVLDSHGQKVASTGEDETI